MFWWWQLVEEENYYEKFAALSRFMEGEDRRDPTMVTCDLKLGVEGETALRLAATCQKSPTRALGWVFERKGFRKYALPGDKTIEGAGLQLDGMDKGLYRVEFWDTATGKPAATEHVESEDGALSVKIPAFVRDIAFKVKPHS